MMETLFQSRRVGDLGGAGRQIVQALRIWVNGQAAGGPPLDLVRRRLGSARATAHFQLLVEELAEAWPEPFAVAPLCCLCLSHDELTLGQMIELAATDDRPGFDRLLGEMLSDDQRERLMLSAGLLGRMVGVRADAD